MTELSFRVADVDFHLHFEDLHDARPLLPSYAPFYIKKYDEKNCIMHMVVGKKQASYTSENDFIGEFDCGDSFYTISRFSNGDYKILISDTQKTPACALQTDKDFYHCKATLYGDENRQSFGLGNAIMLAYAFSSAKHGILLMHASVTTYQNKGYLFLGKSGTGKSTHSKLWRKYIYNTDLLNDDNPVIRQFTKDDIRVYGSPWSGKTPCYKNKNVPIGALVRLEQSPVNIITQETKIKAFASVLSSCSTMIWDKNSYDAILNNVSKVIANVPVFHLKCRPDEEAVQLCKKSVTKQ